MIFLFDSWFSSKTSVEPALKIGVKFIGMVKKNTEALCKETIENLKKCCKGGSYLVFGIKTMVRKVSPLIAIGYKYNVWKVLYFNVTENAGSIQAGTPYLHEYPNQFCNFDICPVVCHLLMHKLFGAVN